MLNKGDDQTARMRRLVCTCVVRKPSKTGSLASRPFYSFAYLVVLHAFVFCLFIFPSQDKCFQNTISDKQYNMLSLAKRL